MCSVSSTTCLWLLLVLCLGRAVTSAENSDDFLSSADYLLDNTLSVADLQNCVVKGPVPTDVKLDFFCESDSSEDSSYVLTSFDVNPVYKWDENKFCRKHLNISWTLERIVYDSVNQSGQLNDTSVYSDEYDSSYESSEETYDYDQTPETRPTKIVFRTLSQTWNGLRFCIEFSVSYDASNRSQLDFAYDCLMLKSGGYTFTLNVAGPSRVAEVYLNNKECESPQHYINFTPSNVGGLLAPPTPPHPLKRSDIVITAASIISCLVAITLAGVIAWKYNQRKKIAPTPLDDEQWQNENQPESSTTNSRSSLLHSGE